jgi:tRNA-specific 2-thiouridylase
VREVVLQNTNWISGAPEAEKTYAARCRYRQLLQECTVSAREDGTRVVFSQPQKSVAPGQSLVVYDGDVCLGGGSIVSSA